MKMQIRPDWQQASVDAVVLPVLEGSTEWNGTAGGPAPELFRSGDLPLKANEILNLPGSPRTIFVGVGKAGDDEAWRRAAATVVRKLRKVSRIMFASHPDRLAAVAEGATLGEFSPASYQTADAPALISEILVPEGDAVRIGHGEAVGSSINWARQLINEPSNNKPPRIVAERAMEMAEAVGLTGEVLDEDAIRSLGMGALIGVAQGSAEPPRVVVLTHAGQGRSAAKLTLVGKGITFDTGGISIKPADGMEKMKYDMAGGASVMAVMRALALLKTPAPVMAVIPLAENMPGGRAQRPGDVVRSMSGKTIEIINTDAEGRLVLADALEFARRRGATHLIDMATLTGAIRVALGQIRVGLFGNHQEFVDRFLAASRSTGERMWQMPLDDEYRDLIKSPIADIANSGGRFAGSITAAKFLEEFAGSTPWIHLDVAGIAWNEEERPYMPKGPSGIAIRTLIEFCSTFDT